MLKELIKVANRLDNLGLQKEADIIDGFIQKMAGRVGEGSKAIVDAFREPSEPLVSLKAPRRSKSRFDIFDDETFLATEPMYTDISPEQKFITRLEAKKMLENMSDEDFQRLKEEHPEAMEDIFGSGSHFEVKR